MKINAKQYAKGLLVSLEGKKKKEAEGIIANFLRVVMENGYKKMLNTIVEQVGKIHDEISGTKRVEVTTAKELDKNNKKYIKKFVTEKLKAENVEIEELVDESILGGVIIKDGDKVYDGCIKTRLYELNNRLNK